MKRKVSILAIIFICIFYLVGCSSNEQGKTNTTKKTYATTKAKAQKKTVKTEARTVLKAGDKGDDVKNIQKKLAGYGYTVTPDGDYGEQTIYAVMDFQQRHGLSTSGIVEGQTLVDLNKKATEDYMYKATAQSILSGGDSQAESTVNSVDLSSYTNYLIMVSIAQQKVYIFNGTNRNWKIINEFSCASGTSGTPTVTGHFFVGNKGPQFTTPNGIVCRYFTQIKDNYLFHSVLFDKKGNLVDGTLGNGVSHGCVRLALENAKYIYDNVPIGSGIWIQ